MKPAPFAYCRPGSLDEASAILAEDEDARIIAGGQTLTPLLAMRLARPSKLVDIMRIPGLDAIVEEDDAIVIGAAARQSVVERNATIRAKLPLLAAALPWVGHPPTRTRGTIGGSIANADPAAEIPLVAATLEADMIVRGPSGRSAIPAAGFFLGVMTTALPTAAILEKIRFETWREARIGVCFEEASARRGDFALAAAAAQISLDARGYCVRAAIGVGGVADRPIRLDRASKSLVGTRLDDATIAAAIGDDIEALDAMSDRHASAAYRRRAAKVMAARALAAARDSALRAQR